MLTDQSEAPLEVLVLHGVAAVLTDERGEAVNGRGRQGQRHLYIVGGTVQPGAAVGRLQWLIGWWGGWRLNGFVHQMGGRARQPGLGRRRVQSHGDHAVAAVLPVFRDVGGVLLAADESIPLFVLLPLRVVVQVVAVVVRARVLQRVFEDFLDLGVEGRLSLGVLAAGRRLHRMALAQIKRVLLVLLLQALARRQANGLTVEVDTASRQVARVLGDVVGVVEHSGEAAVDELWRHGHIAQYQTQAVVFSLHPLAPDLTHIGDDTADLLGHRLLGLLVLLLLAHVDEHAAGQRLDDGPVTPDVHLLGVRRRDGETDDVAPLDGRGHAVQLTRLVDPLQQQLRQVVLSL